MPVTTEVLNEDIKELKAEVRDIRGDLDVLTADVHRIDISLAELRSEVRAAIGFGKWVGTALVTLALTSGITAIIWGASLNAKVYGMEDRNSERFQEVGTRIDRTEVRIGEKFQEVNTRIDRLESRIDARINKVEERIDKLEAKMDAKIDALDAKIDALDAKIDARFDKLEATIARALGQARPEGVPAPKP
jgi:peptidoglycan hydrolase CwlO-like protein